jgi:subtilisin family serine protease
LFARILLISGVVTVLLVSTAGSVGAGEPGPEAIVVDSKGEIVSVAENRSDAAEVFERAVLSSSSERLTLEYVYRSHGTVPNPPNDPIFSQQWNLAKVGVSTAWAQTDGASVVVAVLDSAINFTGFDGFCTSVVSPYDAIAQTEGLADLNTTAEFGHGTHVAGTIAQCTNNATGVAGIAPGASLMPVRVLSDDGSGTSSELARGIDWAVDHGADIINLSLGADCESTWPTCNDLVVDLAIERASSAGVLLVASSGNSALSYVSYPSAHPDVVSVGATTSDDAVWYVKPGEGSNQGSSLDFVAPGVGILQETTKLGTYDYFGGTGTSMAAPHVSAAAALLLSVDPTLTADAVVSILTNTAVDVGGPGFDTATGWGRIAVDAAVAAALPPEPSEDPCGFGPCDTVAWVDTGGQWGLWDRLYQSAPVSTFYFGNPGDLPFMGDWDGDGEATPGLFRQSDGFVYLRDTNTQGVADLEFFFGNPGDVPLVGDFDGDGRDSVSIWRPSEARVFIINELGQDGQGLGAADFDFYFGNPGDTPFIGDFDGDGIDTIGLYRESTGFVYLTNTLASGNADLSFFFGNPGDQVLAGDWDGDGDDTVGVYRPSTGNLYVNLENTNGAADWEGYIGSYPWVVNAGNR